MSNQATSHSGHGQILALGGKLAALMLTSAAFSPTAMAANDYAGQCLACHGSPQGSGVPFSFNGKKNASDTKAAISSQMMMTSLKGLTDAELNAIALEMGGAADLGAPTPAPSATPLPSSSPTPAPSGLPTPSASPIPSASPTPEPSASPLPSASPTPTPSPTPSPSATPKPTVISCDGAKKNERPIVYPISDQNATVGQELSFTVSALDCNDVPIVIKASRLNGGYLPAGGQDFDDSRSWSGKYTFTPSPNQAGKSFNVRFTAQQTEDGRKSSRPWKIRIRVFPQSASYEEGDIQAIQVQSARWSGNKLRVSGKVALSHALSASDRKSLTDDLQVSITDTAGGMEYGHFAVKANDKWSAVIKNLPATSVPCEVVARYHGWTDARTVKKAPATCIK